MGGTEPPGKLMWELEGSTQLISYCWVFPALDEHLSSLNSISAAQMGNSGVKSKDFTCSSCSDSQPC